VNPFTPELLDDIGRCYARAAVDAFLAEHDPKKTAEVQVGDVNVVRAMLGEHRK
jgi:hypothetical protein